MNEGLIENLIKPYKWIEIKELTIIGFRQNQLTGLRSGLDTLHFFPNIGTVSRR